MKRVKTSLDDAGFAILVVAGVNLFLLLCVCALLNHHVLPRYGVNVRPAATHFLMSAFDRSKTHVVTITAGATPCLYVEGRRVEGGFDGLAPLLAAWGEDTTPAQVVVLVVADEAVPSGEVQKLVDGVLLRGYTCMQAARPALDP